MGARRLAWLCMMLGAGCSKTLVDLEGRPCDDGACADGWVCHPERGRCVPPVEVSCDGNGLCPSSVQPGDLCDREGSFIPCSDALSDCSAGCRTCDNGQWSNCTPGDCAPSGPETCDGIDNDCNGEADDGSALGCVAAYRDEDRDGFGDPEDARCLCTPTAPYDADNGDDCDDSLAGCGADCNPLETETCADDFDNDCDAVTNQDGALGCGTFFLDGDGDGLGDAGDSRCLCSADGDYDVHNDDDCDDASGACTVVCDDADGDEVSDCRDGCLDSDGDLYGVGPDCLGPDGCDGEPLAWVSCATCGDDDGDGYPAGCDRYEGTLEDCDDLPGACGTDCHPGPDAPAEVCDNADNDCNGDTDDGVPPAPCAEQDGVCAGAMAECVGGIFAACGNAEFSAAAAANGLTYQNAADESACDGYDNNCDDVLDDGCAEIARSNVPSDMLCGTGDPDLETDAVWSGTVDIDTWTATVDNHGIATSANTSGVYVSTNRNLRVLQYNSLTITSTARVTVHGYYSLVILVCEDLMLEAGAEIHADADGWDAGPGAFIGGDPLQPGDGPSGGSPGAYDNAPLLFAVGGGGGGNCGAGGRGGYGNTSGAGGAENGVAATSIPLTGGSGGAGGGGPSDSAARSGGGGGGAIQLSSNGRITLLGMITANGAGGGGTNSATGGGGGGGGGAGGSILIEARDVVLGATAVLAANAGAGGGGSDNIYDTTGENGRPSATAAQGGSDPEFAATSYNVGGEGAAAGIADGEAPGGYPLGGFGGGGGGGAGRIRINTKRPAFVPHANAVISPNASAVHVTDPPCYTVGTGP